jgi:adenine-specific DNA methylase
VGGVTPKRLIEVMFPLERVSAESRREKNIRHGHISTLHIWWARRPLSASRAIALAALLPDPGTEEGRRKLAELITRIAPWEAVKEGDSPAIQEARRLICEAFAGEPPRVLDPFAGGGAIPLEALRLGCETHALDYNPVAVLLLKAVLELPQRFGRPQATTESTALGLESSAKESPLVREVRRWGEWVLERAREELKGFYPPDPDGAVPVGYLWARTIPCQNPTCKAEIPLMRQTWLARKKDKKVALRMVPDRENCRVDFQLVEGEGIDLDPGKGTVSRAVVECPVCGSRIDADTTRRLFREGKSGQRMVAVVLHTPSRPLPRKRGRVGAGGKHYRLATERDLAAYRAAEAALEEKRERLRADWGLDPVPDEPVPKERATGNSGFRVLLYGFTQWGDLFNARQKLPLITFADHVRKAHRRMLAEGLPPDFAKAVTTFLAVGLDRLADRCSVLCRLDNTRDTVTNALTRQALPMVWDYAEVNPFSGSTGDWRSALEWVLEVIAHCSRIPPVEVEGWRGNPT